MKKFIKVYLNRKGLTLIELLASMTVLAIVIVSFSSFFTQGMLLSSKAEDQLTSINIAEKVLNNVKDNTASYTGHLKVINGEQCRAVTPLNINGKAYYPYVLNSRETPHKLNLERIHVQIFADEDYNLESNSTPTSEVYGYKKLEGP